MNDSIQTFKRLKLKNLLDGWRVGCELGCLEGCLLGCEEGCLDGFDEG